MRKICRVLFSRYAISAIMIVLEVGLFTYLFLNAFTSLYIAVGICAVIGLAALVSLVVRDANPEYKIPWAIIIIILPAFGPLLYLLFYTRRMSRGEGKLLLGIYTEMKGYGYGGDAIYNLEKADPIAFGKARAIKNDDMLSQVYSDTSSRLFTSGEDYFSSMEEDLRSAKEYIFLEYFIVERGELWDRIHAILREKAAMGVDVRLLYDDIGCMKTLPTHYEEGLIREGIKAKRFSKVNPRVSSVHHNRDHRKICVIDGKCAYTGGVNIADEYINVRSRFGHWRDGGIRLSGSAVLGILKLFLISWDFTARTVSDYESLFSTVKPSDEPDGGYYLPFGSGPAPLYKRPVGKNAFLNIVNQAKSYVYITTPYLIIDYDLTEALRNAALRGVDVKIVTPGVADKKIVKIMTKSAYPYLMDAGVGIYEYTPGFIHEKTVVSDSLYTVIGTINLDYRSLVHHFEDAVWIFGERAASSAEENCKVLLAECKKISREEAKLSLLECFFRNAIKIFAPLL